MGRPAGASVLCLFPIPWPEAMVCIFRATAGSGDAARPLEIRLFLRARCLVSAFLERLGEALS